MHPNLLIALTCLVVLLFAATLTLATIRHRARQDRRGSRNDGSWRWRDRFDPGGCDKRD